MTTEPPDAAAQEARETAQREARVGAQHPSSPSPTFAQDVLYVLGGASNETGLSPTRARELTAAILVELRRAVLSACTRGMPGAAEDLLDALDLRRDLLAEPAHDWEPASTDAVLARMLRENRVLRAERDAAIDALQDAARRWASTHFPDDWRIPKPAPRAVERTVEPKYHRPLP